MEDHSSGCVLVDCLLAVQCTINPFFPQVVSEAAINLQKVTMFLIQADKKGASPVVIGVIISSSPCAVMVLSPFLGYLVRFCMGI